MLSHTYTFARVFSTVNFLDYTIVNIVDNTGASCVNLVSKTKYLLRYLSRGILYERISREVVSVHAHILQTGRD